MSHDFHTGINRLKRGGDSQYHMDMRKSVKVSNDVALSIRCIIPPMKTFYRYLNILECRVVGISTGYLGFPHVCAVIVRAPPASYRSGYNALTSIDVLYPCLEVRIHKLHEH